MKYLIQHPEPIGIEPDLLRAGDIGRRRRGPVEAAGWDGLAFTEHPAPGHRWLAEGGGHQTLDPFVALGAAAAVTRADPAVDLPRRDPVPEPAAAGEGGGDASTCSPSGRFVLGVGTGYLKSRVLRPRRRLRRAQRAVRRGARRACRCTGAGEPFSYEGRHFNARDIDRPSGARAARSRSGSAATRSSPAGASPNGAGLDADDRLARAGQPPPAPLTSAGLDDVAAAIRDAEG